ncbi:MAG: hypothetical protein AAFP92_22720 [Bacteroidota bacterium]
MLSKQLESLLSTAEMSIGTSAGNDLSLDVVPLSLQELDALSGGVPGCKNRRCTIIITNSGSGGPIMDCVNIRCSIETMD